MSPRSSRRLDRQENLNRHAALHVRSSNGFPCDLCSLHFARSDLRRRHIRTKHADAAGASEYGRPARTAGDARSRSSGKRKAPGSSQQASSSTSAAFESSSTLVEPSDVAEAAASLTDQRDPLTPSWQALFAAGCDLALPRPLAWSPAEVSPTLDSLRRGGLTDADHRLSCLSSSRSLSTAHLRPRRRLRAGYVRPTSSARRPQRLAPSTVRPLRSP